MSGLYSVGSTQVEVVVLPPCDFCSMRGERKDAQYDAASRMGSWAFMCEDHFRQYGVGLGTGRGQRLVVKGEGS